MLRPILAVLALLAAALPLWAEPVAYRLNTAESSVEFTYRLSGRDGTGTMPIQRADLVLDFDRASRSSASVELDATRTRTGVGLITDALKGPAILDTARHPRITFRSRRFTPRSGGATVTGDVTVRGVTRPLVLNAQIYRRQGSATGDRSRLSVILTGTIYRSEFGASGFPDLVADRVDLRILARLDAPS